MQLILTFVSLVFLLIGRADASCNQAQATSKIGGEIAEISRLAIKQPTVAARQVAKLDGKYGFALPVLEAYKTDVERAPSGSGIRVLYRQALINLAIKGFADKTPHYWSHREFLTYFVGRMRSLTTERKDWKVGAPGRNEVLTLISAIASIARLGPYDHLRNNYDVAQDLAGIVSDTKLVGGIRDAGLNGITVLVKGLSQQVSDNKNNQLHEAIDRMIELRDVLTPTFKGKLDQAMLATMPTVRLHDREAAVRIQKAFPKAS